jgi:hypothetical protein
MSWRDYLIMLLHIGAEIEHGLMVEYLYAAYSLGGDQVPPEHEATVKRWQNEILTVAREEMGHLLSVQNLLCLLGGPVSFERRDFPWDTPFYPFPFRLEPLSLDSLACYVYAEMPPDDALDTERWANLASGCEFRREDAAQIRKSVFKRAGRRHPHHVAELYGLIIEIVSDASRIRDEEFRPESYPCQASWDDWGRGYAPPPERPTGKPRAPLATARQGRLIIAAMATRTEAIAALKEIAGQGEAPQFRRDGNDEPSHFARFVKIYQEFEGVVKRKPWTPVRAVPTNPTTFPDDTDVRATATIRAERSRLWAELFNLRYRILLTCLTHSYRLARAPASGHTPRGVVLHRVFGEMYNLKTIAGLLMRLPLGDESGVMRAGPPFQMPYTLELPLEEADCWGLHLDLLTSASSLCQRLLDGKPGAPPNDLAFGADYLRTLCDLDRQSRVWVEQLLTGLHANEARHL